MRRRSKSRLKFLLIPAALLGVAALALPLLVDAKKFEEAALSQARLLTGREVTAERAELKLFPAPALTLHNVLVPGGEGEPALAAESAVIGIPFSGLFTELPRLSRLTLVAPKLEISRDQGGVPALGWLATLEEGAAHAPGALRVAVENGTLSLVGEGEPLALAALSLTARRDEAGGWQAEGAARWQDKPLTYALARGAAQEGKRILSVELKQAASALRFTGEETAQSITGAVEGAGALPLFPALKFSGALAYENRTFHLRDMSFESGQTGGRANIDVALAAVPQLAANLQFTRLKLTSADLRAVLAQPALKGEYALNIEASAETFQLGAVTAQNAGLSLTRAADGAVSVERFGASLPGGSIFSLAGNIMETATGLRFEGSGGIKGESLPGLLSLIDPAAARLPAESFGAFSTKANVFISGEQLRLSDAEVNVGGLSLSGGMVTYFGLEPRTEAELSLTGTNLDYIRDVWRAERSARPEKEFMFSHGAGLDFAWLRAFTGQVELKVALSGFTFLDRKGERGGFQLYARGGELGLENVELHYADGGVLKGSARLQAAPDRPQIALTAEIPYLDTAYFSLDGKPAAPWVNPEGTESGGKWSQKLFDLGWMNGAGPVSLRIATLVHHGEPYANAALDAQLNGEHLQIQKLTLDRFGGRLEAAGTLIGGKVPGLSASFTLYNMNLGEALQSFSGVRNVDGRVSLSGTVTTSGINMQSWVSQAEAKMVLAARGVKVQGFNLQGIVDGVNAARSVADVVANVARALPSGVTEMAVDGSINVGGGVARAPAFTLVAGRAAGSMSAELQLIPWTMKSTAIYSLPALSSQTVPTLRVDLEGTPEKYALKTDTTSLEAYVAKRIVGR